MNSSRKVLLFVENRHVTRAYDEIALGLNDSFQINWFVFNKFYTPFSGEKHSIFPDKHSLKENFIESETDRKVLALAAETDRNLNYFGGNSTHYKYVLHRVKKLLAKIKPDIVVGERTTFYEIIISEECFRLGIPYLFPQASRYPSGKLIYCLDGSNFPIELDSMILSDSEIAKDLDGICSQRIVPKYMLRPKISIKLIAQRLKNSLRDLLARSMGEVYCTPSLFRKILINFIVRRKVRKWRSFEAHPKDKYLIYPLQMQPESNLDVDGVSFRDQYKNILEINAMCARLNISFYIKANPKAKYEMLNMDLDNLKKNGVGFLPLQSKVFDNKSNLIGVVSVTGTALIEAVLNQIPAFCLGGTDLFRELQVPSFSNFDELEAGLADMGTMSLPAPEFVYRRMCNSTVDLDYPDPSVNLDYYKANKVSYSKSFEKVINYILRVE